MTPQDQKCYSYAKGRRNVDGENDKAPRKSIPRAKKRGIRVECHAQASGASCRIAPWRMSSRSASNEALFGLM